MPDPRASPEKINIRGSLYFVLAKFPIRMLDLHVDSRTTTSKFPTVTIWAMRPAENYLSVDQRSASTNARFVHRSRIPGPPEGSGRHGEELLWEVSSIWCRTR